MFGPGVSDHFKEVIALHRRLAQPLQFNFNQSVLFVNDFLELNERQVIRTGALSKSLTVHIVQRKLQRLAFSISNLIGR